MNLSAQNLSEYAFLFLAPKKELHDKLEWILNNISKKNIDYRSGALDTQADSIYYSTAYPDQPYGKPDRFYITYEHIGADKLPVELTYIERNSPGIIYRFTLNYNDQLLNIGGDIFIDFENSDEKVGYYEQRFDLKGNIIYHYMQSEREYFEREVRGDSLAITYDDNHLETRIESYRLDSESEEWRLRNVISNMHYNGSDELIRFDWDMYSYSPDNDSVFIGLQRRENLTWFGGYNFRFFSKILMGETYVMKESPGRFIPPSFHVHNGWPLQEVISTFYDGEWHTVTENIIDSMSSNYISIATTTGGPDYIVRYTLNDAGFILSEKLYMEDPGGDFVFSYGNEVGYNDFELPVFQRNIFTEDGTVYSEDFRGEYEIDDNNRLLLSEVANRTDSRQKVEYFYNSGVSTSSLLLQNDAVKLFPNPVENKISIQSELDIIKPMQYQIISPDGRTLLSGVFESDSNYEINISSLPSGIYFFKWQMADKYGSQRIVKM